MDISTIIWLAIIIGFALIGSAAKAKKQAESSSSGGGNIEKPQAGEQYPAWFPKSLIEAMEAEQKRAAQGSEMSQTEVLPSQKSVEDGFGREFQPAFEGNGAREITKGSQESIDLSPTLSLETEEGFTAVQARRQKRASAAAPASADSQKKTTDNSIKDGEIGDIIEDFDLRRAVIYSEILKPKFQQ